MPIFDFHLQVSFPEQSVKKVLEQFVDMVNKMDSTVLVPSRLMDISVKDIAQSGEFPLKDIDLRAAYTALKMLSLELKQGLNNFHESEDTLGLNSLQENLKIFLFQIKELTFCATFLKERYQYAINNSNHETILLQDVKQIQRDPKISKNVGLIEALCQFVDEAEEMEREILFPCLLQDITASELCDCGTFIDTSEVPTVYDLFLHIKTIKKRLLCGLDGQKHNEFCSLMKNIFYTVRDCTNLANSLTARYQKEIEGF